MARETQVSAAGNGRTSSTRTARGAGVRTPDAEPSIGELFKELAQESSMLVKQEIALARTEMQQNLRRLGKDAAMVATGGGVLLLAALVLTAFLVAGIGDLLGNEYWLGALIVGTAYAIVGGGIMMRGLKALREEDLKPEQSLQSLHADRNWARGEARQIKHDLKS
jgi:hypothetical protein